MSSTATSGSPVVRAQGLVKRYEQGRITALDGLDLEVESGEFVAVCGPSGCGKSTLLNMISGVDQPDDGELEVAGRRLGRMSASSLAEFRRDVIGLVFQLHNLIPNLTALENVQIPMLGTPLSATEQVDRARELLRRVGLEERGGAMPPTLSGGERQRVAVARALANRPHVILADEPTGSLDSRTGERLCDLLSEVQASTGATLIVVTHDAQVASRAGRVVHMLDGRLAPPDPAAGGPVASAVSAR